MLSISIFESYGAHRALHSFPTRRSSDLHRPRSHAPRPCAWSGSIRCSSVATGYRRWSESRERSEEHTSELQSLTNLVCRLLLEKKNNFALSSLTTSFSNTATDNNTPSEL